MLDDTDTPIEAAEVDAPEVIEAEEVSIGFEGDEAPEVEAETPLIKQLRAKIKEEAKAARDAKAKIAEYEAAKPAPPLEEKPTIASCNYDDAAYEEKLAAWYEGKAARDASNKAQADAETARQSEWVGRIKTYDEQKAVLKVPDFAEAEDAVRSALSREQQAIIVRNIDQPAAFVYALGKNADKVAELAAMKDLDRFTAAIVRLEGKVKVETRKAPPPESRLPGSAASMTTSANLAKLQEKARATGDYTAYRAAKRQAEAAGQKA